MISAIIEATFAVVKRKPGRIIQAFLQPNAIIFSTFNYIIISKQVSKY